jgi:hypothetical protein
VPLPASPSLPTRPRIRARACGGKGARTPATGRPAAKRGQLFTPSLPARQPRARRRACVRGSRARTPDFLTSSRAQEPRARSPPHRPPRTRASVRGRSACASASPADCLTVRVHRTGGGPACSPSRARLNGLLIFTSNGARLVRSRIGPTGSSLTGGGDCGKRTSARGRKASDR